MFNVASIAVLSSFFVSQVAAHGGVIAYVINGRISSTYKRLYKAKACFQDKTIKDGNHTTPLLANHLLDAPTSLSCNNNGQASGSQLSATVPAGSTITAKYSQWTHAEGPVMVYMANCNGPCSSANSNSLKWFKIDQTGLISGTVGKGKWGNGLVMDTLQYTTKIPAALAAGNYLIRHELLALHQANTPQFYPECAQLIVTGGGGQTPSGNYLVSFPGAYGANDPGVNINIYTSAAQSQTTYQVPGPAVWTGN
ncbi:Cellulose-growth-specific protein [Psilocybe cubensis]|uniref:Cellulose-growth-specific protein n=1 Tax=Psilocybe cubensis TaxID=181762 RepID=A0ACB8H066_PSICU|nr:Cellulose-growth-specific protein [Psilocybe cubensis]KAH9481140.1 Cellulose-growth-specific protein [Psilocybe cubensis]